MSINESTPTREPQLIKKARGVVQRLLDCSRIKEDICGHWYDENPEQPENKYGALRLDLPELEGEFAIMLSGNETIREAHEMWQAQVANAVLYTREELDEAKARFLDTLDEAQALHFEILEYARKTQRANIMSGVIGNRKMRNGMTFGEADALVNISRVSTPVIEDERDAQVISKIMYYMLIHEISLHMAVNSGGVYAPKTMLAGLPRAQRQSICDHMNALLELQPPHALELNDFRTIPNTFIQQHVEKLAEALEIKYAHKPDKLRSFLRDLGKHMGSDFPIELAEANNFHIVRRQDQWELHPSRFYFDDRTMPMPALEAINSFCDRKLERLAKKLSSGHGWHKLPRSRTAQADVVYCYALKNGDVTSMRDNGAFNEILERLVDGESVKFGYKVNSVYVTREEYDAARTRRKSREIMVSGPEGERILQEELGLDISCIKEAPPRQR